MEVGTVFYIKDTYKSVYKSMREEVLHGPWVVENHPLDAAKIPCFEWVQSLVDHTKGRMWADHIEPVVSEITEQKLQEEFG